MGTATELDFEIYALTKVSKAFHLLLTDIMNVVKVP